MIGRCVWSHEVICLSIKAAGRDEAAARELLELRQGEFLPVLGLVDPRYAHAAQGQHVRGRRRTALRLLLLEEHFNLHVAGQCHAEDVRHQLDQGYPCRFVHAHPKK